MKDIETETWKQRESECKKTEIQYLLHKLMSRFSWTERLSDREKYTERKRENYREREIEKQRQRDRDRETERQRDRKA
jgi:hypothetical protein